MKTSAAIVALNALLVVSIISIGTTEAAPSSIMDQEVAQTLSKPLHEFGGKLLLALHQKHKSNLIYSPISIHQALSMLLVGADQGSETRREILNAIGYSKLSDEDVERYHQAYASIMGEFSNITAETLRKRQQFKPEDEKAEYYHRESSPQTPVLDMFTMMVTKNKGRARPEYTDKIIKYFNSSISNIDDGNPDSKARLMAHMNEWGKKNGFDSPILTRDSLEDNFEAILIAAISVEAFWFEKFYEHPKTFNNFGLNTERVTTKFLGQSDLGGSGYIEFTSSDKAKFKLLHGRMSKDETFVKMSGLNFQAVKIGLQGDISLTILEPLNETTTGQLEPNARLNKLTENLLSTYEESNETNLDRALKLLDDNQLEIDHLFIPKFKFESDIDLNSALYSMGLKRAFDMSLAEISNITDNKVFVGDVKHKAVIETTKQGIKAAGVTIAKIVPMMAIIKQEHISVSIENPFVFLLRYKSVPLFVGRVTNLPKVE